MKPIRCAVALVLLSCSPSREESPPIKSNLGLELPSRLVPRQPMCLAAGSRCTESAQCCSNHCDVSRADKEGGGVCGGMELIDGPLVDVAPAIKARDPRLSPPSVEEAFAAPFKDGTLVSVRFGREEKLGRALSLQAEDGEILLQDTGEGGDEQAGDGLFSAVLPVKFDEVAGRQKEFLAQLRQEKIDAIPIFEGRELVGMRKIDFELRDRIPLFPFPLPFFIDAARSLMITNTSVVEDPTRTFNPCTGAGTAMGKWTFGHLMSEMANEPVTGINPSDFTLAYLSRWQSNQVVNTFNVPPRFAINNIINNWPKLPDGRLDLARAPLKLLAIVNRIDLAGSVAYGAVGGAEGRFVFEVIDQNTCSPMQFLVIFEYGVPRHSCLSMKDWAQKWKALSSMVIGSPAYNAALEALTEEFAKANADLTKFNGSAINQVRTNEIALSFPWELREFKLMPKFPEVPLLREATVKQNPDIKFNATKGGPRAGDLGIWINNHTPDLLAGTHVVTNNLDIFPFDAFLGASTLNNIDFWNAPGIVNLTARHKFSLATCNGCHGRETNTIFTHVKPAPFGSPAGLSGFLTGIVVNDPVTGTPRMFNDLAARAGKLNAFASASCFIFPPPFPLPPELPGPFPLPPIGIGPVLAAH